MVIFIGVKILLMQYNTYSQHKEGRSISILPRNHEDTPPSSSYYHNSFPPTLAPPPSDTTSSLTLLPNCILLPLSSIITFISRQANRPEKWRYWWHMHDTWPPSFTIPPQSFWLPWMAMNCTGVLHRSLKNNVSIYFNINVDEKSSCQK